jgi:hypothetical protein
MNSRIDCCYYGVFVVLLRRQQGAVKKRNAMILNELHA